MMPEGTEEAWERRDSKRNWKILTVVAELAKSKGVTQAQIALAWVMSQPAVGSTIMGVRTMSQLETNLAATEITLAPEEMDRLGQVSKPQERYPYRFIEKYGSR
jgi:aryl-alcohol dehydrogenase-like predicted oxidoreductase